ncbi:MAG: MFS transporter [Epsilonproteobacteria bacterium]|nr:MAG: MFS transporter [Campylobacterota bacterium]
MFKQVAPLSTIIALRFFGLFIVLPTISIYAISLPGSSTTIVGLVIGGYAITQMVFQIPFGAISDKIGRKTTITIGLLVFAAGSVVSAMANDINMLIAGRFLQGAGAIGAVVTAMISDLVVEHKRTKAMAIMGGMIAGSFALAMILGPLIGASYGIGTLFYITAFLSILSIVLLYTIVPNPPKTVHDYHNKAKLIPLLFDKNLFKMNITNMLQKSFMTFVFMISPIVLIQNYGWNKMDMVYLYLPAMIAGVLAMGPAAMIAEKRGKYKEVLIIGVAFFAVSFGFFGFFSGAEFFITGVVLFFVGFNMHEPIMQSVAVKFSKTYQKGLTLGVFNSFGYFGTFTGGVAGGYLYDSIGLQSLSFVVVILSVLWLVMLISLTNPKKLRTIYIKNSLIDKTNLDRLNYSTMPIQEWYENETENIIVVKFYEDKTDEQYIKKAIML